MIMKGKDGFDFLPLATFRCDGRAAVTGTVRQDLVDHAQPFGLGERFRLQGGARLLFWGSMADSTKPILNPVLSSASAA